MIAPSEPPTPLSAGASLEDLATLGKNDVLGKLPVRDLGALLERLDQVAVHAGNLVVREGDEGDDMFFILEGSARATRKALELRRMGPGDHFGELALLGTRRRAASIEAITTLRLARLSRARFHSIVTTQSTLALHLLQALVTTISDDLAAMTDNLGLLLRERSVPRRTEVRVRRGDTVEPVATGTLVKALVPADVDGATVVAAFVDQKPLSLDTPLVSDATIAPITLADHEGRDVFRRSLGLLLLEAANVVAPNRQVRIGPSLSDGQVVSSAMPTLELQAIAPVIQRVMMQLIERDVPFREELWSVEEARAHFAERGWADAAALLHAWRNDTVPLVSCGEVYALSARPLLTSAGGLGGFSLSPHPDGLLLDFGPSVRRHLPARDDTHADPLEVERATPRFNGEMAREHRAWLGGLGIRDVGTYNEFCVAGEVPRLTRVAEGFHEKRIGKLADDIAARRDKLRVICIAGPSSSGKTTLIKRLTVQLEIDGFQPLELSLDDYYVDRAKSPRDANGDYDFEAFEAIDSALLRQHLARLLVGEAVNTAHYDFLLGKSLPDGGKELQLEERSVLLVEGIHGLNPALFADVADASQVFRLFVHPATTLPFDRLSYVAPADLRLLRRIVRDRHGRGYSAADSILRWPSVRRGERVHIYPYQSRADAVFDTALAYEISVLKVYADRYLLEVPQDHPAFATAYRLRHLLDRFVTIYPDHVPPTSVLREFIGGSGFEY